MADDLYSGKTEEEATLPKATVAKIIKEILPNGLRCAKDTQELVVEAGMEFLQMVSSQANDICTKEGRQKMNETHVIAALKELNFDHYISEVAAIGEEHKVEAEDRKKKSSKRKLKDSGLSQEELLRQQEALFAKSRHVFQQNLEASLTPISTPRAAAGTSNVVSGAAAGTLNVAGGAAAAAGGVIGGVAAAAGAHAPPVPSQTEVAKEDAFAPDVKASVVADVAAPIPSGLAQAQLAGMEDEDDDYDDI